MGVPTPGVVTPSSDRGRWVAPGFYDARSWLARRRVCCRDSNGDHSDAAVPCHQPPIRIVTGDLGWIAPRIQVSSWRSTRKAIRRDDLAA